MYKLSLAIVIILLVGCKEEKNTPVSTVEYKAVHNACDNNWAFRCRKTELGQTSDYYLGLYNAMRLYHSHWKEDTCVCMELGSEVIFKDSISAVRAYERYNEREQEATKATVEIERYTDSLFKCHHSYE